MSSSLSLVIRFAVLFAGFSATANYAAPTAAETAAVTTTKAAYPLKTCVVSGGKLGSMGKPVEYVHKQAGQPDRTVICSTLAGDLPIEMVFHLHPFLFRLLCPRKSWGRCQLF